MNARRRLTLSAGQGVDAPVLLAALIQAREMVDFWAEYADEHFRAKWDIDGDLAILDEIITRAGGAA